MTVLTREQALEIKDLPNADILNTRFFNPKGRRDRNLPDNRPSLFTNQQFYRYNRELKVQGECGHKLVEEWLCPRCPRFSICTLDEKVTHKAIEKAIALEAASRRLTELAVELRRSIIHKLANGEMK